jgi:hypothetical protein
VLALVPLEARYQPLLKDVHAPRFFVLWLELFIFH